MVVQLTAAAAATAKATAVHVSYTKKVKRARAKLYRNRVMAVAVKQASRASLEARIVLNGHP